MKIRLSGIAGLCLTALLGLVLVFQLGAQAKKAPKLMNVQGSVEGIDKAKNTISVKVGTASKPVMYGPDTKFLMGHSKDNKPGSVDAVKDRYYISCAGTYTAGKPQLMATECVYRETK